MSLKTPSENKDTWNTAKTKAELAAKFSAPAHALFFEVGDGTGMRQRRWADAVAMSLWPSKGLEFHGFEIKVSRADWLRELKKPEKAESVQQYCDRWWLVAGNKGVIKDLDEMPSTWGLIERSGQKLRIVRQPQKLNARELSRDFIAALLRRANEADDRDLRERIEAEADRIADIRVEGRLVDKTREISNLQHRLEQMAENVKALEEAVGLPLTDVMQRHHWRHDHMRPERIGATLRLLMDQQHEPVLGQIERAFEHFHDRVAPLLERIDRERTALLELRATNDNGGT